MHSSIPTLLLFAVTALTSPMVNDKRDSDIIWDHVTVFTTTSVTGTPSASVLAEVEAPHRHRHISHRAGSPLPPAEYGFSLIATESLPVPATTTASIVNLETSSAKTAQVGSSDFVIGVSTVVPTSTLGVGHLASQVNAPVSTVVPADTTVSKTYLSSLDLFPSFISTFSPVESSQFETPVSMVAPTDIPDFKTHPFTPNPFTSFVDTFSLVESSQFETPVSMVAPTDIPDFKTHPFTPNPFTSFIDTVATATTIITVPTQTQSFASPLSSQATTVPSKTESPTSSTPAQLVTVPTSSQILSSSTSDLKLQTPTSQIAPPTTFVPDLDTSGPIYKALVLQHHNVHRRNHSADDLTWNDKMAEYAETIAKTCVWGHNLAPGGGGYGQNIAAGVQTGNISAVLSNMFYNGEMPKFHQYGIESPDLTNFEAWGHFSQMVWKNSTSVGCYTAICSPPGANALDCKPDKTSYLKKMPCGNGGVPAIFTVCNYYPKGNFYNDFSSNVGPPLGNKEIYVDMTGVHGL